MVTFMEKRTIGNPDQSLSNDYRSILENKKSRNTLASKQMLSTGLYEGRVTFNELLVELAGLIKEEIKE